MDRSSEARSVHISPGEFEHIMSLPVRLTGDAVLVGHHAFSPADTLLFGDHRSLGMERLVDAALRYHRLTGRGRTPQLAALLFDCTGERRFLRQYFPLAARQDAAGQEEYMAQVGQVAGHPHFALRLIDELGADRTGDLPASARWIAAGHLVEVLWHRRDILKHLLSDQCCLTIAVHELAQVQPGPHNGPGFVPALPLPSLYAGCVGSVPGVTPVLSGIGHLLIRSGGFGRRRESLLGMERGEALLWTMGARDLYVHGKRLEQRRYSRFRQGRARMGDPMPIGRPELFRDDRTFLAGYLEVFFRAPRYFAAQNPMLFEAFRSLLRRDPSHYLARDCAPYVDQSRAAYTGTSGLPPSGLRVGPRWWPW